MVRPAVRAGVGQLMENDCRAGEHGAGALEKTPEKTQQPAKNVDLHGGADDEHDSNRDDERQGDGELEEKRCVLHRFATVHTGAGAWKGRLSRYPARESGMSR